MTFDHSLPIASDTTNADATTDQPNKRDTEALVKPGRANKGNPANRARPEPMWEPKRGDDGIVGLQELGDAYGVSKQGALAMEIRALHRAFELMREMMPDAMPEQNPHEKHGRRQNKLLNKKPRR
jgi:hypothetical protein